MSEPTITQQQRGKVMLFLDEQQRTAITCQQWQESYQSWAHGGHGWNRYGLGGTYINAALAWYQHIHKPGSKEWRPPIIMAAVIEATQTRV
jgi:hypothetical protein